MLSRFKSDSLFIKINTALLHLTTHDTPYNFSPFIDFHMVGCYDIEYEIRKCC